VVLTEVKTGVLSIMHEADSHSRPWVKLINNRHFHCRLKKIVASEDLDGSLKSLTQARL
jgi:hypothetical protein